MVNHTAVLVTPLRDFDTPQTVNYQISNGVGYASSTVMVVPVAASARLSPPVARDDTVRVRVGDVATVAVLANDTQPDGVPMRLLPDLIDPPNPNTEALVFTSGNVVRVHARQTPGAYTVLYQVAATQGVAEPATGRLTVYVIKADPDHNQAPKPADVAARTVANQPVVVPIPLDGIDPDGDSVTLVGIASAPAQGVIASVAGNQIVYDPAGQVAGAVGFTYTVRDRGGAEAVGKVTVGVAPAGASNSPPVAVTDQIDVRPGAAMSPAVLANDYDPDGDAIALVDGSAATTQGFQISTISGRVTLTAPTTPGDYSATYQIVDTMGQTATGIIAIHVKPDVKLQKPVPVDDFAPMAAALVGPSVTVDVSKNDDDPGGDLAADTIGVTDPNAVVVGGKIQVTLTDEPQIIDYTLTNPVDPEHLVGQAFVFVPGASTTPPQFKPGTLPMVVKAGTSKTFALSDYVIVRAGRSPRLTSADKATAWNGIVTADSKTQLTFAAPLEYAGPASVMVQVTDGADLNDKTGLTATVTIPVTVTPRDNLPPVLAAAAVTVAAGENGTVDLARYATDRDAGDTLTFQVVSQPDAAGLQATLAGNVLTVAADATVPKGTVARMRVQVDDGHGHVVAGDVTVTVVASTRPLAQAIDDVNNDAAQGQTYCVPATANDVNPFPDTPLVVLTAKVTGGAGVASVGCAGPGSVSVTPDRDFFGQMTVVYTVQDKTRDPDRNVQGTIRLTVKGRPDPPAGLHIDSVGDQTVVLSWQPPNNNGSPITGYTVTAHPGGTVFHCPATICTLTGLTNNVTYTFVVRAINKINPSDPSAPSAEARPDVIPHTPGPPAVAFVPTGRAITLSWSNPGSRGSPVQSYNLYVEPRPDNGANVVTGVAGTSYTWGGLTNGTPYHFKVCPVNLAPGVCAELGAAPWSGFSAWETPAAPPDPPGKPAAQVVANLGTEGQVRICWAPPANSNGDPVAKYTVTSSSGAQVTVGASGNASGCPAGQVGATMTQTNSSEAYTYTVTASNKAGASAPSPASGALRVVGQPGAPSDVSAAAVYNKGCTVTYTPTPASALNGSRSSEIQYVISANGKSWPASAATTQNITTGLTNGTSYTFTVKASTTVAGALSPLSQGAVATAACVPYGTPNTPGATAAASGATQVKLTWTMPAPNGRPIAHLEVCVDGSCTNKTASGSVTVGNGYSQTHSITVTTVDTLGDRSTTRKASATSNPKPPPPPSVTVSTVSSPPSECANGSSCSLVVVNLSNFPSTATCTFTLAGGTYRFTKGNGSLSLTHWYAGTARSWTISCTYSGTGSPYETRGSL